MTCVNKDYAVVMCRLGTKEVLIKAQDKHGAGLNTAAELRDVVADCDKYASLYNSMTTSVLAGCIQVRHGHNLTAFVATVTSNVTNGPP